MRVTLSDARKKRYMVPIKTFKPKNTTEIKNYKVTIKQGNFGLKVFNKIYKKTMLDTTLGPLIFADQFLQVILIQ